MPTHQCLLINMGLLTSIRISTIHIHSCVVNIKSMFKQTFTVQLQQTLQSKCKIHNILIDIYICNSYVKFMYQLTYSPYPTPLGIYFPINICPLLQKNLELVSALDHQISFQLYWAMLSTLNLKNVHLNIKCKNVYRSFKMYNKTIHMTIKIIQTNVPASVFSSS